VIGAPLRAKTPPVKQPAATLLTPSCRALTYEAVRHSATGSDTQTRTVSIQHSEPVNKIPIVLKPFVYDLWRRVSGMW
jgi:hypothetical protein